MTFFGVWLAESLIKIWVSKMDAGDVLFTVFLLFASMYMAVLAMREWSRRKLLRNGVFTVGTVVAQKKVRVGRGGSKSAITYHFSVQPEKSMLGKGEDHTGRLQKNCYLLVCYDPEDIAKNVALNCTYWRVYLTDGNLVEP